MLSATFQKQDASARKGLVLQIKDALINIDGSKYPSIRNTINSGNTKINALLNLIINQMYVLDFDIEDSLLAVEENI